MKRKRDDDSSEQYIQKKIKTVKMNVIDSIVSEFCSKIKKTKDEKEISDLMLDFELLFNFQLELISKKKLEHMQEHIAYLEDQLQLERDVAILEKNKEENKK